MPFIRSKDEYNKFFETGFENFADATSFHGYNELYHAKTRFWRYTWLIIVAGAFAITIYQVYSSVLTYMSQGGITTILPVEQGQLIYPPLDVCYIHWITWIDWGKALSLNFTKETLLYSLSYITEPVFSSTIFNIEETKEKMLRTFALNNITSLSEVYKDIAKSFPMVMAVLGGGVLIDNPPFFNNITFRVLNDETYLCYSLSGNDIIRLIKQSQQATGMPKTGRNVFNFSIQDPNFSMYKSFLEEDEYNFRVGNWLARKTNYWLPTIADYQKNYTGFTLPARIFPDAYSDNYVEISKENDEYNIEMVPTVHRQMNTATNPCVVGKKDISTEHQCEDICLAKYQKKLNICLTLPLAVLIGEDTPAKMCSHHITFVPLLINGSSSLNQHTISNVKNAEMRSDDSDKIKTEFESCIDACDNPCEIWKYQFTKSVTTLAAEARALSFKNQTDVRIAYPEESNVLVMIDVDARTWEDFVGNVGGLLGVWTGASIVSFIELVYLCFCKQMTFEFCSLDLIQVIFKKTFPKQSGVIHVTQEASAKSISTSIEMAKALPPPV